MPKNKIELLGIDLEVPDATRYLEALSQAVQTTSFYPAALRKAVVEAHVRHLPAQTKTGKNATRAVGFVGHELIVTLDREWQDYANNEADRLFEYASSRGLFDSIKSVTLCGAGPCRLADYIASLPFIEKVLCSDLSWPALHFGRSLIEANYSELPALLTQSRAFYHVESQSTTLVRTTSESRFKPPLTPPDRRHCIRYAVRDAFAAWDEPIAADLIVVPYLLDVFRGAQCINLLLRICQHVRVGQQIVILVTCVAEGNAGPGRDPELILDVLRRCGFKINFLDLTFLPYSFSYYSYSQVHTDWNTLVVRAERLADRAADVDIARSDRWNAFRATHPDKITRIGFANLDLILSRLRSPENYRDMAAALIPQMGEREFEDAIGELLARGLVDLHISAR
jgi:hypothetical protein